MKTEGYIANHLSTALVTAPVPTIHTKRQHTMNGTIIFKRRKIPSLTSKDSSLSLKWVKIFCSRPEQGASLLFLLFT